MLIKPAQQKRDFLFYYSMKIAIPASGVHFCVAPATFQTALVIWTVLDGDTGEVDYGDLVIRLAEQLPDQKGLSPVPRGSLS